MPGVVDMFYREVDAEAILGYLVFVGLSICLVNKVRRIDKGCPYSEPEFLGKLSIRNHIPTLYDGPTKNPRTPMIKVIVSPVNLLKPAISMA